MSFRKNVPYNIQQDSLAASWVQVLAASTVPRLGDLSGGTGQRTDLAFSGSPPASGIVTIGDEVKEFALPAYEALYARAEGGGAGPAELHGTLWAE